LNHKRDRKDDDIDIARIIEFARAELAKRQITRPQPVSRSTSSASRNLPRGRPPQHMPQCRSDESIGGA